MVLVDTSAWVDFFNGHASAEARTLQRLIASDEVIAITGVILTEILSGLKTETQATKVGDLLSVFEYLDGLTQQDYLLAAKIYRTCRGRGTTLSSTVDCLIAQLALSRNCWLLTKDKDFQLIKKFFPLKLWKIEA
ncbi:MAG: PIN domain nuclease [Gammaproteobacteria bacterium]|nr:PIN domain nuclease [Gammaproteobacteria bacterium]